MKRLTRLLLICSISLIFLLNNMVCSKSKKPGEGETNPPGYVFNSMSSMNHKTMTKEINKIKKIQSSHLDIQVSEIGKSVDEETLYLIKIQPVPAEQETVKMMIIGRQHGNEPAGTTAIFSFISDLINGNCQIPNDVTLLLVPMANPDGANNNTRNNANDKNLNRDWDLLSQPETSAVYKTLREYNPEIFLDLHEFSSFDNRDFDMTYCPGIDDGSPAELRSLFTAFETIVDSRLEDNKIDCDKSAAKEVG